MPKGSKKRKASKKKAHHHHNSTHHDGAPHSSQNNSHGEGDMKQHDDKESDGEEANSLTSQDNRNSQLELTDGEKEEREEVDNRPHSSSSSSDESQSVDETLVHSEAASAVVVVPDVDQDLKLLDPSNGNVENAYDDVKDMDELKDDNTVKESCDDDGLVIEKKDDPLIDSNEVINKEKSNLIDETGSVSEVNKIDLPDGRINGDGDKDVILLERNVVTVPENSELENGEDEINISSSPRTEGNLIIAKNTPRDSMDNVEQKKDIAISESSVTQPLLGASPERRTSWMNCCGLFEAFSGSGR